MVYRMGIGRLHAVQFGFDFVDVQGFLYSQFIATIAGICYIEMIKTNLGATAVKKVFTYMRLGGGGLRVGLCSTYGH